MNVEITTEKIGVGFMMLLKGDVDMNTSPDVRNNLGEVFKQGGAKALLVNLSGVRTAPVLRRWSRLCRTAGSRACGSDSWNSALRCVTYSSLPAFPACSRSFRASTRQRRVYSFDVRGEGDASLAF
jgi:hypothetical protein